MGVFLIGGGWDDEQADGTGIFDLGTEPEDAGAFDGRHTRG